MDTIKEYRQQALWVVEVSDDQWYGGDDTKRNAIADECTLKAINQGCTVVAIMCTPDDLFPHPKCATKGKHRVFHKVIMVGSEDKMIISVVLTATIDRIVWDKMTAEVQQRNVRQARDEINRRANGTSGRYCIRLSSGQEIENGRV